MPRMEVQLGRPQGPRRGDVLLSEESVTYFEKRDCTGGAKARIVVAQALYCCAGLSDALLKRESDSIDEALTGALELAWLLCRMPGSLRCVGP